MIYRIYVKNKKSFFDSLGASVKKDIADLGITGVTAVDCSQVYYLSTDASHKEVRAIAEQVLCDRVCEDYVVEKITHRAKTSSSRKGNTHTVEIGYKPGVMDPWEFSVKKAIRDFLPSRECLVHTAKRYCITGALSETVLAKIIAKLLSNPIVNHRIDDPAKIFSTPKPYRFKKVIVDILGMDDKALAALSKRAQLYLTLEEMKHIKDFFAACKRNPTDCELETIAQTWSEHCKHKTMRGIIEYRALGAGKSSPKKKTIRDLLGTTIMKVTKELRKPWCVSVFADNSGIIRFDDEYNVCFKVETHNHPSSLEPFGGANTGIGGVIRDCLGTGLGARPIANTDVFCFAPPGMSHDDVPSGLLHPARIMKEVVRGVKDYGNKMGIPTVNGAVMFHKNFLGNPLVYCGTVGILKKEKSFKKVNPGDAIVVAGGGTGRDGIHGATFSSSELTHESEDVSQGAVQIGNPIEEKKLVDAVMKATERGLFDAITDCGAGGLSSAVGELGESCGAEVWLEKVPLKYKGLSYAEIWISESQERMVLAVPRAKLNALGKIFAEENVSFSVIGRFTDTKRLRVLYHKEPVVDLDMRFLHKGVPKIKRPAVYKPRRFKEMKLRERASYNEDLLKILSSLNIASKEWIIRQYDHEVQGGSVIKPLLGKTYDGPSDAAVVRPRLDSTKALAIGCGINPLYGEIDPYWMAASSIDEAVRQVVAVGGSIHRTALLDNFCWADVEDPYVLGDLVRASQACYDIAKKYGLVFISGKDSLNNEFHYKNKRIAIPPTLLISSLAVLDDARRTTTMEFKRQGNPVFLVGTTYEEMGGSAYYHLYGYKGTRVPRVFPERAKKLCHALTAAIAREAVVACHDCSDGGFAVALAEMAFAGGLGITADLRGIKTKLSKSTNADLAILFSESNSRFIVEVDKDKVALFRKMCAGIPLSFVGETNASGDFAIHGIRGARKIFLDTSDLKSAWQSTFGGLV